MLALAFTLGDERCAVDVREVHRVLPAVPSRVVRGAPAHLAGVIDYHGAQVTVIDLQAWAGGPPARAALVTRLVLLNAPGPSPRRSDTAVLAEQVDDVIAIDDDRLAAGVEADPARPWRRAQVATPRGQVTVVSLTEWAKAASRPGPPRASAMTGRGGDGVDPPSPFGLRRGTRATPSTEAGDGTTPSTEAGEIRESCWREIGVYAAARPTCPLLAVHHHCRNCDVFHAAGRGLLLREPAAGYLEAWGRQIAEGEPAPAGAHEDVLVLQLGDERVALPVAAVREVVNARPIRRLPPPHDASLLGLTSVRGALVPCFAPEVILGRPALNLDDGRRFVVAGRTADEAFALLVTDVAAVRRIEVVAESPDHLPDQVTERALVRRHLALDEGDVPLIDPIALEEALGRRG